MVGAGFTYVVIDGIPVQLNDYRFVGDIKIEEIKSVEIIRNAPKASQYFKDIFNCGLCSPPPFPAVLAIYTYSGSGLHGTGSSKTNLKHYKAPEFSLLENFIVLIILTKPKQDYSTPDLRTLIHWQPNLVTNNTGKANTSFYTSDKVGAIKIICEAITADGKIGYAEANINVEK